MAVLLQSIADYRDLIGHNAATASTGQPQNCCYLRQGDLTTSQEASQAIGEEEVKYLDSHGRWQFKPREVVSAAELRRLPITSKATGLTGFATCPQLAGYVWKFTLPGRFIARHLPQLDPKIPRFVPAPPDRQKLRHFSEDDFDRLGFEERLRVLLRKLYRLPKPAVETLATTTTTPSAAKQGTKREAIPQKPPAIPASQPAGSAGRSPASSVGPRKKRLVIQRKQRQP